MTEKIHALSIHCMLIDLSLNEENIRGKEELSMAEMFIHLYADVIYRLGRERLRSMKEHVRAGGHEDS